MSIVIDPSLQELDVERGTMAAFPSQLPVTALDRHAAREFIGTTVVLLTLSLAAVTARVVFKIRSRLLLTLDDYLIVAGAVRRPDIKLRCLSINI